MEHRHEDKHDHPVHYTGPEPAGEKGADLFEDLEAGAEFLFTGNVVNDADDHQDLQKHLIFTLQKP